MIETLPPFPARVRLDDLTEDDFLRVRGWFIASRPETQTCRPVTLKTDVGAPQQFRDQAQVYEGHDFAIRGIADGRLLGRIRYFGLNVRKRSVEIGHLLDPEDHGPGYATEVLGLLSGLLHRYAMSPAPRVWVSPPQSPAPEHSRTRSGCAANQSSPEIAATASPATRPAPSTVPPAYEKLATDTVGIKFEIAPPDKPDAFSTYIAAKAYRAGRK